MTTTTKTGVRFTSRVDQWLDTLPAADSEDFREFSEVTPSIIEIGYMQESCNILVLSMTADGSK